MTTSMDAAPRPTTLRVYVNERGLDVPAGATALDAVRAFDAAEAERYAAGTRGLTDSRGLPVPPTAAAHGGAIYRLVSARAAAADAGGAA
jgi:hypothetical protein